MDLVVPQCSSSRLSSFSGQCPRQFSHHAIARGMTSERGVIGLTLKPLAIVGDRWTTKWVNQRDRRLRVDRYHENWVEMVGRNKEHRLCPGLLPFWDIYLRTPQVFKSRNNSNGLSYLCPFSSPFHSREVSLLRIKW